MQCVGAAQRALLPFRHTGPRSHATRDPDGGSKFLEFVERLLLVEGVDVNAVEENGEYGARSLLDCLLEHRHGLEVGVGCNASDYWHVGYARIVERVRERGGKLGVKLREFAKGDVGG